ncbi:unnamed protein product [Hymenolepis diminuta]|uniref:Secreted protein n=2 Tax=Hymenolepis diminuta TaxID=6216 RepID=A0A0R3SN41_HYMDI|nr:unnamed protein product [Hymenolepis diminuta]
MIVIVLLVYAKFHAKKYQQAPVTVVYPESKGYGVRSDTMRSKHSSSGPPSGHLISVDSGRFSSHQMHVHYTGSAV